MEERIKSLEANVQMLKEGTKNFTKETAAKEQIYQDNKRMEKMEKSVALFTGL